MLKVEFDSNILYKLLENLIWNLHNQAWEPFGYMDPQHINMKTPITIQHNPLIKG